MIRTVPGIMGDSIVSLQLVLKSLLSTRPWLHDPSVVEIDWRKGYDQGFMDGDQLTFGFMESDGVVNPHPPIARALRIVAKALREKGHKVSSSFHLLIKFEPSLLSKTLLLLSWHNLALAILLKLYLKNCILQKSCNSINIRLSYCHGTHQHIAKEPLYS